MSNGNKQSSWKIIRTELEVREIMIPRNSNQCSPNCWCKIQKQSKQII